MGVVPAAFLIAERTVEVDFLSTVLAVCREWIWDCGHPLLAEYLADPLLGDSDSPGHLGLSNSWVGFSKLFDFL